MIRISPPDARGRVAGMFSSAFLIGSVGGPVLGSLTAGLGAGGAVRDLRCGAADRGGGGVLQLAAFVAGGARGADDAPTVTLRVALRNRAYRSALFSNFATGWSVFGLRMALVPLFVTEVLHRGPGWRVWRWRYSRPATCRRCIPSGYLSDRLGRRTLLIIGLAVSGVATALVGRGVVADRCFLRARSWPVRPPGMFSSPQQAAVADIIGSKARGGTAVATYQMMADVGRSSAHRRSGRSRSTSRSVRRSSVSGVILLCAAVGWVFAPETRGGPTARRRRGRWAPRPAASCPDLRL